MVNINTNPSAVRVPVTGEDQAPTNIPIGFNFPMSGTVLNQSWMSENGVVTFQDPDGNTYCCSALPINSLNSSQYDYTIFPLWTDWSAQNGGELYTLGGEGIRTYGWYNVNEYGTNNRASFELTVRADGTFTSSMSGAVVSRHAVMSGYRGTGEDKFQSFYNYTDGISNKNQTWSYGLTPATPDVLLNDTYVLRADTKTVEVYTWDTYENKKRGVDFIGYDPKLSTAQVAGEEEEEEEKEGKAELDRFKQTQRSKYLENLKTDIKSGKIAQDDYFKNDLMQIEIMRKIHYNNPALNLVYQTNSMPDAPFYKDKGVYLNQKNTDNLRVQKALQSEGTHKQMVDQQWSLE